MGYSSTIENLLNEGTAVICDRYAFSGIAFSASKVAASSSDSKLPFEWCRAPDIGLPAPDVVLFLDIAPEQAKLRGGYGEERYEKEEMQARVRKMFKKIGEEFKEAEKDGSSTTRWTVIDAGRDRDIVEREMWESVKPLLNTVGETPLGKLWTQRI